MKFHLPIKSKDNNVSSHPPITDWPFASSYLCHMTKKSKREGSTKV